jgi:cytochrome c556
MCQEIIEGRGRELISAAQAIQTREAKIAKKSHLGTESHQRRERMKKMTKVLIVLTLISGFLAVAHAQFANPEDAIQYRQSVMFLIGQHFGRMAAVVKGQSPYDKAAFEQNAAIVDTLAPLPWEAFMVPGTDKGKTDLKSSAFKEKDKFMQDAEKMEAEVAMLAGTAKTGDLDAIKIQFGETGKSCKSCHDDFRK